jgi:16S rRNA G527 N7-methylase RsmG
MSPGYRTVSVATRPRIEESVDLREHVELLSAHYRLSSDVAGALGTLAAMAVDPDENVLPRRPATNRLIAIRLSSCAAAVELQLVRRARQIVDIGSGLGFPGLVLASMVPTASFTLVEAKEERCAFLRRAVAAMALTNVEVINSHAQRWTEGAMSAELVTARALAGPRVMVRLSAPMLVMGGTAVIWAEPPRDPAKEAEAHKAAEAAGLRPLTVYETKPVGLGERYLYVYEKVAETPARRSVKADRRVGRPALRRAQAVAIGEAQTNAEERLQRAAERVRQLESSEEENADIAAELQRARAVVRKVERKIAVLAQRRARAERRLRDSQAEYELPGRSAGS